MRVSVVLAAYNGEKYIIEQLQSLFQQTRQPDEVIILDDLSTDNTVSVVRHFISEHGLSNWKLIVNRQNKGHIRNFLDGAQMAVGDLIFYSDQDDIWERDKIEIMAGGFDLYSDMKACYCLKTYITEDNEPIHVKFQFMTNSKKKSDGFQKISLEEAVRYNNSAGLCLCIKKELIAETRDLILDHALTHDLPIGTVAAIYDGYYVVNKSLVRYRQHAKNVSAPRYTVKSRLSNMNMQIKGQRGRCVQMQAVMESYGEKLTGEQKRTFEDAIGILNQCVERLESRDHFGMFKLMFTGNPMINRWAVLNNWLVCLNYAARKQ